MTRAPSTQDATALREQLRAARGRGPAPVQPRRRIEDIKARCEEETHLPAPQAPQFPRRRAGLKR
jgi:N-methylhydantoinase B